MAEGHQAELFLFPAGAEAHHPDGRAKGAPLAKAEQGFDAPAHGPGRPRHGPQLQPQRQLPAGRMGPGRRPPMANGGGSVVARGRTAIGAGQVERAPKTHRLQGQGQQACGAAKGIEVHQLKTLLALQAPGQERLGR